VWRTLLVSLLLVAMSDVALAQSTLARYREYPNGAKQFVVEQFGAQPDKWQEELLEAWVDPTAKRISLQACAGPGKTCGEAWCGWHFLGTQVSMDGGGYEHPNGFATSITGDNLRDNLWKEFAKWQARSDYLRTQFTWTSQRIFENHHQATWFLAARSWPKTGSAEEQGRTFSGLHGKNVLVLVDESGAIPPTILRAGEQALPNTHFGKILQGGNPISLEGMLYEAAGRLRHLWRIIRVTGDPDDPKAWVNSPRVAAAHVAGKVDCDCAACWSRQQIQTYSRENPWVQSYILGVFPPTSLNSLLSLEEVLAAQARELTAGDYEHMQRRIGVDVARFGDDRTVLAPRQGLQWFRPVVMRNARTNEIAARVWMAKKKWNSELELVDDSFSWGHGVIDNLVAAGLASCHGVNFAGKAIDPRYKNRRAEGWLTMADAVKGGASLPNYAELVAELTTPTYTFVNGVFLLEEKDQVKKRLGRSPDLADAYALTYMLPDLPGDVISRLKRVAAAEANHGDWDPFASQS
jgi:phage terminase large subunit